MEMKLVSDQEQADRAKMYAATNGLDELCADTDAFTCMVSALSRSDLFDNVEKGVMWNLSEQITALNARLHYLNRQLTEARGGQSWPEPTLSPVGTN